MVPSRPDARPRSAAGTTSGITPAYAALAALLLAWTKTYAATTIAGLPANASNPSPTTLKAVPITIHGRRRPHRDDVLSLRWPAKMGTSIAKMPPAAVARPTTNSGLGAETSIAPTGSNEMLIGCQWGPPPTQKASSAARRPYPSRRSVDARAAVVAISLQAIVPRLRAYRS